MSTIIILVAVGLLVWLYNMGYLLQAILCLGALLGVGVLHEKLGGNGKKQLYGIPFGCALVFGLLLWLFGCRWHICLGGPLLMLGVSTMTQWKSGGQKRIRIAALVLLAIVAAGAFGLNTVSKNNLGKDARIADLEQAFEDNSGSVRAEGFEFVRDGGNLAERYPAPYLFCWYNAAGKDGNSVVRFSAGGARLQRYYLSQEDVSRLKTVIIAIRHMTVSQPVVSYAAKGAGVLKVVGGLAGVLGFIGAFFTFFFLYAQGAGVAPAVPGALAGAALLGLILFKSGDSIDDRREAAWFREHLSGEPNDPEKLPVIDK